VYKYKGGDKAGYICLFQHTLRLDSGRNFVKVENGMYRASKL